MTALAYFMVALDALVVVTALPSIHRDLGGSASTLQWTVNAYNLTFATGIITAAALGDRLGRAGRTAAGWPCSPPRPPRAGWPPTSGR